MRVAVLLRKEPWYRRNAFVQGLKKSGHEILVGVPNQIGKSDALLIWNRYADNHGIACRYEKAGGVVLVAENGYLGKGGTSPKFDVHPDGPMPHHYYTIQPGFHNRSDVTWIPRDCDEMERLRQLSVALQPWRHGQGSYILVCPNRSFGIPGRMMPIDWVDRIAHALKKAFSIPVKIRKHPENGLPKTPLQRDLDDAAVVVIWSSSVGVHALHQGIPVVCCAPDWICKPATYDPRAVLEDIAQDITIEARDRALGRMAWAQWTCEEIESGLPFGYLLPKS
jgi:hypothetical protein